MIRDKRKFMQGLFLLVTFVCVFFLMFMPLFGKDQNGKAMNGLEFSDDLFNKLSKGSSNFVPEVLESIKAAGDKPVNVEIKVKAEDLAAVQAVLAKAGAEVTEKGGMLTVKADMGKLLTRVAQDSELMYNNDGAKVKEFYGMDEKKAVSSLWKGLAAMIKPLQKADQVEVANLVDLTLKKAVEPGYNYYGIPAESILDKWATAAGLLIFYVVYTMWYGYSIFDLFAGMGLSMSKSKIKKEA